MKMKKGSIYVNMWLFEADFVLVHSECEIIVGATFCYKKDRTNTTFYTIIKPETSTSTTFAITFL